MSPFELPAAGGPSVELADFAGVTWAGEAEAARIDLTGFDPAASLPDRLAWAAGRSLPPATALSRYSSKMQHSTADQVRECCRYAARNGFYAAPELLCVDEAVSGRKSRREGLDRVKEILARRLAPVLLVYKVSRLFRVAYKGFQFFQEEVVEENLRAVSVSQGIDTADEKRWKQLLYLHGMMDDLQIATIADGVRSSLSGMFEEGFVTGALPVGFRPREVPGARPTRRGRPRTAPEVDPGAAALIRRHAEWVRDGMPLAEGLRRWVAAGGPCDPRSTTRRMTAPAYRGLLSNPRLLGLFAFGRKRNLWSSKRDYTRQVEGPETEVVLVRAEELRILSDELFHAVQERLEGLKSGPRGPKARRGGGTRETRLSNLVTDVFVCGPCTAAAEAAAKERGEEHDPRKTDVRFYVGGAHGAGMRCKHAGLCPTPLVLERAASVRAVCDALSAAVLADAGLVEAVVGSAARRDAERDGEASAEALAEAGRRIAALTRKIGDLDDRAGEGTDEDRAEVAGKVRAARRERAGLRAEEAKLRRELAGPTGPVTPEGVREALADLAALLDAAAAGRLGEDVIHKAAAAFRVLVGGRVVVHAVPRPGRKRADVRAVFAPDLLAAARDRLGLPNLGDAGTEKPVGEVEVWLRRRACDALAERAAALVDRDGLSFASAAAALTADGHPSTAKRVWALRRRHYEMTGAAAPERPYNNGRPRRPAAGEAA